MNGVPLDLEGKVNEEQGIRRNCTGQCLNTSLPCRNSGQCIEGYASYTCDCNNTAFDGFYCHKGELIKVSWQNLHILTDIISSNALEQIYLIPHWSFLRHRGLLWDWLMAEVQHTKETYIRWSSVGQLDWPTLRQLQPWLQWYSGWHRVQFQHCSHTSCVALHQLLCPRLHRYHPQEWR